MHYGAGRAGRGGLMEEVNDSRAELIEGRGQVG